MIGSAFKGLGRGFAESLFQSQASPFIGLFIGILATGLIQSSSTTTSLVVGMVAAGTFGSDPKLAVAAAVPYIMGANIGTSITNTIVSLGHIVNKEEFKRAFSASVVHDFFNILAVIVIFPLELASIYDITDYAKLKIEYYFLGEVTGDKQEYADSERRSFQPKVNDDQLLVQLELNF